MHHWLLALLSPLDPAALAGMEQLRAGGSWHHVLGPVAPPFPQQHLLCAVSLHLLPPAAPPAHGLLLWSHPGCHQEGKFRLKLLFSLKFGETHFIETSILCIK